MYDLIIVGGGPAGSAAAIYAARKQLKTLLITDEWGGQSTVSPDIQNWVGTKSISGADLAKSLKEHVEAYAGDILKTRVATATALAVKPDSVAVTLSDGTTEETKTLLVASGSSRRKLDVPGAKEFDQKGLTYCATCDGPLFGGKDVVVVGGGNAAFETAAQLLAYAKSVTLLNRSDVFKADEVTVAKVLANPKMKAIKNAEPLEVIGEKFVTGFKFRDANTKEEQVLPVQGVFVEIGLLPNTAWLGEAVSLSPIKQVVTDPRTQKTSHPRIWAAGDCTDALYHQNNIAAGDAVKALEDIYMFLHTR
ncbi:MAG: FAD-dependent oxidoreductase [Parcubacteria group bacterium]|nr:FAD-dependent oxidoreductase [Parcubacteria group bacterium]